MKRSCSHKTKICVSIIECIVPLVDLEGNPDTNWPENWQQVYIKCGKACRETWANENDINGHLHFVCGDGDLNPLEVDKIYPSLRLKGDRLFVPVKDGHRAYTLHKVLYDMKYCLENFEFDYYVRPHTGSYIKLKELQKKLESCPRKKFYSGCVGDHYGPFVSGSFFVMSRDVIEYIVKDLKKTMSEIINKENRSLDDVALGYIITSGGFATQELAGGFSPRHFVKSRGYATADDRLCLRSGFIGDYSRSTDDFVRDKDLIQFYIGLNTYGPEQISLMKEIHEKLKKHEKEPLT